MTVKHYIIISSSYVDGTRIAMDFTSEDKLNFAEIAEAMRKIKEECGHDVSLSTQCLSTRSAEWSSVVEYDSFFDGIVIYRDIDEFIKKIRQSRVLTAIDIAKYVLSKYSCTHTKLQKLVYFCYADYLCQTQKRLFEDKIYAFTYGPVVSSIYDTCKKYHHTIVNGDDSLRDIRSSTTMSSAKSKIIFSEDGSEKLVSIDDTLQRYGGYTAKQLVDITHQKDTPWSSVYDEAHRYQVISDKQILEHHFKEQLL